MCVRIDVTTLFSGDLVQPLIPIAWKIPREWARDIYGHVIIININFLILLSSTADKDTFYLLDFANSPVYLI